MALYYMTCIVWHNQTKLVDLNKQNVTQTKIKYQIHSKEKSKYKYKKRRKNHAVTYKTLDGSKYGMTQIIILKEIKWIKSDKIKT